MEDAFKLRLQGLKAARGAKAHPAGDLDLRLQLAGRSGGNIQELNELLAGLSCCPLGDVARNGYGRAPHLSCEAKPFLRWEGADLPNELSARFTLTNNRTLKLIYQAVETTPQTSSWTGTWLVDERESVELKQTGDEVTGKYDRGRGTITGVVKTGTAGETVDGTWKSGASTGTVTILPKPNGDIELRFFFNKELLYKKFGKKTSP